MGSSTSSAPVVHLDSPAEIPPEDRLHARSHPMRWVTGALVLVVLGFLVLSFARGQIDWGVVRGFLTAQKILSGFAQTILISVLAMLIGIALGTCFAVMRLSANPVVSTIAWLYVWLFRGTPVLLQLMMWFNLSLIFPTLGVPGLFQAQTINVVTPFVAALLGLGINEGAYLTEVIRGGILSVDAGQTEAASALGLSRRTALAKVVLPQAMPAIIPPIGNEAIGMLKTSSLAATISYTEILTNAQQIYYVNGKVMELLIVAAFWYLVATSVTSVGQYYLERRFHRSAVRRRSAADQIVTAALARLRRGAR
ncbi:amino acid ABC transporter permease [Microbispora sp. GKU 823]|uniref:amino acid ABC transporter permease n=1 Tax=Microbispora sp. GKU 823 TaxID=1652100 RepID=UPI0009A370A5|nr:amino acid ABC transporter permease [Microbispora sp. GKU 823]